MTSCNIPTSFNLKLKEPPFPLNQEVYVRFPEWKQHKKGIIIYIEDGMGLRFRFEYLDERRKPSWRSLQCNMECLLRF